MLRFTRTALVAAMAAVVMVGGVRATGQTANPAGVEQAVVDRYEAGSVTVGEGEAATTVPYRILGPAKVEAGKTYPLVLFLHGAGERGSDNIAQLKYFPSWMSESGMREKYPCFVVAPQCPTGRRWGSLDWRSENPGYAAEMVGEMKAVLAILEKEMAGNPVDRDRVYLTGLSMGGYGSWELATREGGMFAAVAPICGAGDVKQVGPLTGLPIWAWHGDADRSVPVERSREMAAAIKAAGGMKIMYMELAGVGHDSWTAAYTREDGVVPWLFSQRRGG